MELSSPRFKSLTVTAGLSFWFLINTSMNVRGEPIVNTLEQAYSMIIKTDMDYIVLGKLCC